MTVFTVGLIGLSLLLPIFFISNRRSDAAPWLFLLCAFHCAAVLTQNEMLKSVTADAHLYFYDTDQYSARPFALGTSAIVYAAQFLKSYLNLEFVDLMLVFGMSGAIAIILLCRWVVENLTGRARTFGLFLCFLPGLHFWTSPIGKDAPMALGIILVIVAAQNIRTRLWLFGLGALICLLIRPHVFIILMAAWMGAHIIRSANAAWRIAAMVLAIAFVPIGQILIQNFLGINIFDLNDVSAFVSERRSYVETTFDEGVVYISNPILRIIYFTFSPLFYDASGVMAYIVSIENFIIIIMMIKVFIGYSKINNEMKTYSLFLVLFIIVMIIFLGLGGYNVGLALRQKVMFYPALILLFLIVEHNRLQGRIVRSVDRSRLSMARRRPLLG